MEINLGGIKMNTNYNKIAEKSEQPQTYTNKQVEEPTKPKTEETKPRKAIVFNCHALNIRKEPVINAQVECVVNAGIKLTIGETANGWTEVYNKQGTEIEGYVMEQYIKEV